MFFVWSMYTSAVKTLHLLKAIFAESIANLVSSVSQIGTEPNSLLFAGL